MNNRNTVTPTQLQQAILTVLDYLWHEERNHFLMSPSAERADHIFTALTVLARWLGNSENSPLN